MSNNKESIDLDFGSSREKRVELNYDFLIDKYKKLLKNLKEDLEKSRDKITESNNEHMESVVLSYEDLKKELDGVYSKHKHLKGPIKEDDYDGTMVYLDVSGEYHGLENSLISLSKTRDLFIEEK